jgi:hypothetical protein
MNLLIITYVSLIIQINLNNKDKIIYLSSTNYNVKLIKIKNFYHCVSDNKYIKKNYQIYF